MLCIFLLVKNVSCQSKPQRVAAEAKAKQAYSPNTSLSYVISLWTGKQWRLLHVTNDTKVFYYPCGAKDSSQVCLFKTSEEGKWSDDMWRMEIKRFHQLIIGQQLHLKTNIISGHASHVYFNSTPVAPWDKTERQRKRSLTLYFSPCVEWAMRWVTLVLKSFLMVPPMWWTRFTRLF